MSLNRKKEIIEIAKVVCRDLRENSTKERDLFEIKRLMILFYQNIKIKS
jgi:hypothetical protein